MEQKANKFVYAIAKKLIESQGCHEISRQDVLQVFEQVINRMPKKDPLKTELQRNIATYTNKLDRWVSKKQATLEKDASQNEQVAKSRKEQPTLIKTTSKKEPADLKRGTSKKEQAASKKGTSKREPASSKKDTSKKEETQESSTRFAYNLFADRGFLTAVEDLEGSQNVASAPFLLAKAYQEEVGLGDRITEVMLNNLKKCSSTKSTHKQVDDLIQLYRKDMMVLVGNQEHKALLQCLDRFYNAMNPVVEEVIADKDAESGRKLQEFFLDFLSFASFQYGKFKHKEAHIPSYEDFMAVIMALFIDLSIFLSRNQTKAPSHYGKKALCRLQLLLGHAPLPMLCVLLQLSEPVQQDAQFMMPIYKKVLSQVCENSCPYYCSFVLASRQANGILKDAYSQENSNIVQTCVSMDVPKDIISWLTDKAPAMVEMLPPKVKRDVNKLTTYLLKEAPQDVCEGLLDGMSLLESSSGEESSSQEEETVETEQPLFFMDTSMNTESESDNTKALKTNIDSLILGLDSDNKQDKTSDSDNSSQSDSDDEGHHVAPAASKRQQASQASSRKDKSLNQHGDSSSEDDSDEEEMHRPSRQQPSRAASHKRGKQHQDEEMDISSDKGEGGVSDLSDDDKARPGPGKKSSVDDEEGKEEDEEASEVESDEERSDKRTEEKIDQSEDESNEESDEDERRVQRVNESPRRLRKSVSGHKRTSSQSEQNGVDAEDKRLVSRVTRSTHGKSQASESQGDETYMTCIEDVDDKDVFFDADDDIAFKNTSPEKTPPSKDMSAEHRSFMDTPNTYLSNSKRKLARINMNGSKVDAGQTTLDKFFPPQAKSPSTDDPITIIPETQLSGSEIGNEELGAVLESPSRVLRNAAKDNSEDEECVITATRSPKKLTPPPSEQQLRNSGKSKSKLQRLSRRLKEGDSVEKDEGSKSPVYHLTESQLSAVVTQADQEVVLESDDEEAPKIKDKQLEDIVIQGIKEIRKSVSPPQSPRRLSQRQGPRSPSKSPRRSQRQGPNSPSQSPIRNSQRLGLNSPQQSQKKHSQKQSPSRHEGKQDTIQQEAVQDKIKYRQPVPLSPTVMVIEVNGTLLGSKQDIGNEMESTKTSDKDKPGSALTQNKRQQRKTPRSASTQVGASKVTSPPSAKKAAADFGNVYRMMAGIGLSSQSSQSDHASSLEDFKLTSSSKKSQKLQPSVLLDKFSKKSSEQDQGVTKSANDEDEIVSLDNPVRVLRSRTVSESSQFSETSVSSLRRRSRSKTINPPATQVSGKPPLSNSSSKRRSIKAGSLSEDNPKRELRSRHTSDDESLSPPRSRRSKHNNESSVPNKPPMQGSPQKSQSHAPSATQVSGKPPIPNSKRRSVTASSSKVSLKRQLRSRYTSDEEPSSPPRRRRSKRNSESSVASEHSMPGSPQKSQQSKQTREESHLSQKLAAATTKDIINEENDFSVSSPPRIRRSKRNSESSVASDHSVTAKQSQRSRRSTALSQSTGKLHSTYNSSQESGVYPLPSSLRNQDKKTADNTIMSSQESITATQLFRRDIDMRKLKYSSMNDDEEDADEEEEVEEEEDVPKSKKKRTTLRSQKIRSSPSHSPSPTQASSSTLKSKRKSSRKK